MRTRALLILALLALPLAGCAGTSSPAPITSGASAEPDSATAEPAADGTLLEVAMTDVDGLPLTLRITEWTPVVDLTTPPISTCQAVGSVAGGSYTDEKLATLVWQFATISGEVEFPAVAAGQKTYLQREMLLGTDTIGAGVTLFCGENFAFNATTSILSNANVTLEKPTFTAYIMYAGVVTPEDPDGDFGQLRDSAPRMVLTAELERDCESYATDILTAETVQGICEVRRR